MWNSHETFVKKHRRFREGGYSRISLTSVACLFSWVILGPEPFECCKHFYSYASWRLELASVIGHGIGVGVATSLGARGGWVGSCINMDTSFPGCDRAIRSSATARLASRLLGWGCYSAVVPGSCVDCVATLRNNAKRRVCLQRWGRTCRTTTLTVSFRRMYDGAGRGWPRALRVKNTRTTERANPPRGLSIASK